MQALLFLIVEEIEPRETHVNVSPGMVHCVVVIPKRGRSLVVRVNVDSRLTWQDHVGRKAVGFRRSDAAMQVYSRGHGESVGMTHDRPSSSTRSNGWTWQHSLISPDRCPQAGENLKLRLPLR